MLHSTTSSSLIGLIFIVSFNLKRTITQDDKLLENDDSFWLWTTRRKIRFTSPALHFPVSPHRVGFLGTRLVVFWSRQRLEVDFIGFKWLDQGLVSLALHVPLSELPLGRSTGPQTMPGLNTYMWCILNGVYIFVGPTI